MKKFFIILSFIFVFSLSALYLFEVNEVHAADDFRHSVIFQLSQQQKDLGITFADGTTGDKYGYFDDYNGFYEIINGSISQTSILPNRGFNVGSTAPNLNSHFNAFVKLDYQGRNYITVISKLTQTYWFLELDKSYINLNQPFIFKYEFIENRVEGKFTFYDSSNTLTTVYDMYLNNLFSLGEQTLNNEQWTLNPPSFDNKFFAGWTINGIEYSISSSYNYIPNEYVVAVARYTTSDSSFIVSFYDGLNLIGVKSYPSGIGTILPDNFTFGVGQSLIGWSLKLNGSIVDLSTFNLTEDVYLYAVKSFNPDSTINGGSFELDYSDCGNFNIPCHLGNAFIYFLNEFPLVSDVVSFIYPISGLLEQFPATFNVLESLGYIFYIVIGILFVTMVFKLFR